MSQNRRFNNKIPTYAILLLVVFFGAQFIRLLQNGALSAHPAHSQLSGWMLALLGGLTVYAGGRFALSTINARIEQRRQFDERQIRDRLEVLAAPLGLKIEREPRLQYPVLVGHRDGIWLSVHLAMKPHIIALHRLHLPDRFDLRTGTGGEPLGNALLDNLLRAEGAADIGIDWSAEDLAGPLLEALHGHPDSFLDTHSLTLRNIDEDHLAEKTDLILDLISALRRNMR